MNTFFHDLAARATGDVRGIRPRLPASFESNFVQDAPVPEMFATEDSSTSSVRSATGAEKFIPAPQNRPVDPPSSPRETPRASLPPSSIDLERPGLIGKDRITVIDVKPALQQAIPLSTSLSEKRSAAPDAAFERRSRDRDVPMASSAPAPHVERAPLHRTITETLQRTVIAESTKEVPAPGVAYRAMEVPGLRVRETPARPDRRQTEQPAVTPVVPHVNVHIGRIEVRPAAPVAVKAPREAEPSGVMSLDAYLRSRARRGSQ